MVTVTLIGSIFWYPSVMLNVTVAKFVFVFVNWLSARFIFVVPASVLAAAAVPLNVKSLLTSYKSLSAVAV